MIGKNNQYLKKTKEGTKVETYSIKKFKIGTASVVIGASIFFGAGAIAQASEDVSKNTTIDNSKDESVTLGSAIFEKVEAKQVVKEVTKEEVTAGVAAKLGVKETEQESVKEPVKTLDKTQLSSFISEIEEKISSGVYANKTEESIANLVADLNAAKETLASATTQEELTKAYQKLVVSVNSKLRNKPVEKKGTPVVDSTTIKETVGNKAENVKKKVEANSIENTGAKDQRTGKEIAKNTAFRAAVNQDPKVDFTFSIPAEKKIYIYNEEHFSLEIPVYSETGKIRFATIKQGSRQRFANVAGTDNDLDVEFGFTATVINRAETKGVTFEASQANPAKIVITGRPNDILKKHRDYTKKETQTLNVGTRYVQVVDDQGRENLKKGIDITDPGYFYLVLKAQSKKYALRSQPTDEKISVSSLTNPTAEDLQKIKDSIQLEYSQNNEDARFADKRGTLVEHPEDVIQSVSIVGNNIVVTFTDGSTKTKPVSEIVQKNIPPVVNLPYSNETNRNIYIYSGEETDLTFTATDESKIKDMKLRGSGTTTDSNVGSGLTVGKIVDSSVVTGEGSVSEDKKTATIKMTGTTGLSAGQKWTSVIVAKDDNSGESASFDGSIAETSNSAERQKTPGYVEFLVKNQTSKYDIKVPEGKVSVVDPSNPTTEEFERIKEKVKIEYSQTNDDANLASKRGQAVDNQATRISTITKDANGNLVVTYKDGSTDTKPLSEFTSLNKQPAIDAVNKAAEDKIAEINRNTNATAEEKEAAIQKVNADKTKALTAINDNSVTTKAALDNAKTSGTTAISNDNPVATKKDTAKAAIDTALREKEAAIDANNALTTEEKNAAKVDAQAKATAAKTAIDNATTNAAVDSAKTAGTTSVSSVTPTAVAKPAAKNAIDEALKAKEAQLNARTDLTDEEKKAAKADAQARATAAKVTIDNATTNATVDSAKTSGVTDVESVNPQASQKKTDAKNAVEDALAEKIKEIEANNDLTDEEKATAKQEVQDKATAAKEAINNARTNDAVTQAKENGTTEVNNVDPQPEAKTAAKKAVEDKLAAQLKVIENTPDATDEEKKVAAEIAKSLEEAAKQAIDHVQTDVDVKKLQNDSETRIEKTVPLVEDKPNARKAIDEAAKTKKQAIDARIDLSERAKELLKAQVDKIVGQAKKDINNITKLAELDKIVESQKEVIKAVGVVNVPAKKVIVKDSTNLTDAEKEAVKKAIEEVNPGATVVDDKGNITVIMPDGSTVIISKDQLVKTEVEAKAKDGGDNINLNFDKVLVTDLNNITKEDKVKFQFMILGAITDVEEFDINSLNIEIDEEGNAKVTLPNGAELAVKVDKDGNTVIKSKDGKIELVVNFDAKGNATVVTNDGKVLAIPAEKIFREKAKDASTEDRINTPANRVLVTDKENLTAEELTMVKESVEAVNPGVTVVVDAKGNVTITTKDGKSAIISVDQLVKTLVDVVSENDGDNINLNFEKQEVADLTNLKDVEKAAARAKILSVNPNAVDVIFDAKGNATVVLKDGKAYTILSKDVFSQKVEVAPSEGNNEAVNAGADVDNNAQDVTSKLGQRLANTGTTETNTGLAGLGLGILGGLLAATRRRKNDKN